MANPLFISQVVRRSGVVHLTVVGHGLQTSDKGKTVTVAGAAEQTLNGSFTIDQVTPPDTIRFKQSGNLHDIAVGLTGGAVSIG